MQQNESMMRLDRFLSGESEMTRSEVKKKIKSGLVEVNGITAVRPEQKILEIGCGLTDGSYIEITEGLEEGEHVIVS